MLTVSNRPTPFVHYSTTPAMSIPVVTVWHTPRGNAPHVRPVDTVRHTPWTHLTTHLLLWLHVLSYTYVALLCFLYISVEISLRPVSHLLNIDKRSGKKDRPVKIVCAVYILWCHTNIANCQARLVIADLRRHSKVILWGPDFSETQTSKAHTTISDSDVRRHASFTLADIPPPHLWPWFMVPCADPMLVASASFARWTSDHFRKAPFTSWVSQPGTIPSITTWALQTFLWRLGCLSMTSFEHHLRCDPRSLGALPPRIGVRILGCKAPYGLKMECENAEERRCRMNPIVRDGGRSWSTLSKADRPVPLWLVPNTLSTTPAKSKTYSKWPVTYSVPSDEAVQTTYKSWWPDSGTCSPSSWKRVLETATVQSR